MAGQLATSLGENVIWVSILGVAPFYVVAATCAALWRGDPERDYRGDFGVGVLGDRGFCAGTGAGKVGMIAGLFFGLAFGLAGIGWRCWGS